PYYRDSQYPPMYFHPLALALDLAYYRLNAGELDEKKEREIGDYLELAHFRPVGYKEARTTEEKLQAVHQGVLSLLSAYNVDLPAYMKAANHADRARAL